MGNRIIYSRAWLQGSNAAYTLATDGAKCHLLMKIVKTGDWQIISTYPSLTDILGLTSLTIEDYEIAIPQSRWADLSTQLRNNEDWVSDGRIQSMTLGRGQICG
jgi:hypothetical protein